MTVAEANYQIASYRMAEKVLRSEINRLKEFIRDQNADPETILLKRNEAIYKEWKSGKSIKQLSAEFKLASGTIRSICKRIEAHAKLKSKNNHTYKTVD